MKTIRHLILRMSVFLLAAAGWAQTAYGEYTSKGKRDPFVPLLTEEGERIVPPGFDEETGEVSLQGLTLQGILFDPEAESYAVINGRIVREQEEVEGIRVLKVEPNGVTVLVEGRPHQLTVRQPMEETTSP